MLACHAGCPDCIPRRRSRPCIPRNRTAQHQEPKAQPPGLRRLFTTFAYLVAKQGTTAVLGLAYWAVATRLFSARDVGLAAAASSTAFFLGAIGALGIPLLLLAEIDALPPALRRVSFSTGMYISCLAVLVLSLATLALSPFLGDSLRIIGADSTTAALFVIGSVATMGGLTFDNAAIGLHRGSAQLWRGTLNSVLKLAIVGVLVLVGTRTAPGLLFAWAVAMAVSLVVCIPMLRLEPTPAGEGNLSHRVALTRRYGVLSLKHHVLNLSINSINYIIALIAALLILPQEVAYFSTALLVSSTAMIIPYLLALSLFAEISGDQTRLRRHVRRTLPLGLALSFGMLAVVEVAAPLRHAYLRPRLRHERDHPTAPSPPGGPRLRDQGPLRGDPSRAGPPERCGQGDGGRHLCRNGRRGVGRNLLGHDGPVHRMGHRRRV